MRETPVLDSPVGETRVAEVVPAFVSVDDAGRYLGGIVKREIYRLLDRGELDDVRHGRRRLIDLPSLERYADKLRDEARKAREAKARSTS
jgi:excisionase family DNA binding protein